MEVCLECQPIQHLSSTPKLLTHSRNEPSAFHLQRLPSSDILLARHSRLSSQPAIARLFSFFSLRLHPLVIWQRLSSDIDRAFLAGICFPGFTTTRLST